MILKQFLKDSVYKRNQKNKKIHRNSNKVYHYYLTVFLGIIIFPLSTFTQPATLPSYFVKLFDRDKANILYKKSIDYSIGANAHEFMNLRAYLGANNALISASPDLEIIEYQRILIENIIKTASISKNIPNNHSPFKDKYRGWISLIKNNTYNKEVILYEGYSFFYITQFLFFLQENHWVNLSSENAKWWHETLSFLEQNIWTKWLTRSRAINKNNYRYFLRGRIHIASHWAGIAMYLKSMTTDSLIKRDCDKLQQEYDLLLKRNLKPNPLYPSASCWNATYDNTEGTDAVKIDPCVMQDVSHGNHVVSYIIAAYEMGDTNWGREDIDKLCNTVKFVLYNKDNKTFSDNVNGSPDASRPGWGNFVADGWVKLADYDTEVRAIFKNFEADGEMLKRYNQELQFKANLHKKEITDEQFKNTTYCQ